MEYIERITPKEFEEGMKKAYDVLSADEFWEVRGIYPEKDDLCYATKDRSCYYIFQTKILNFAYFATEKKLQNIRGLFESLISIVLEGHPYIYYNGLNDRYNTINKFFYNVFINDKIEDDTHEYFFVYAAHPENISRALKLLNRGKK